MKKTPRLNDIARAADSSFHTAGGGGARKLVSRGPKPMALEQRFMFDGAGMVDAVHALNVDSVAEHSRTTADRGDGRPAASTDRSDRAAGETVTTVDTGLFILADASPLLAEAAHQATAQLREFLAHTSDADLFRLFSGQSDAPDAAWLERAQALRQAVDDGSFQIRVVSLDHAQLNGTVAAYAHEGPLGQPTIFVSRAWFAMFDAPDATRVLLEEMGHAIDHQLNESRDTAGDEGESFAAAVMGARVDASAQSQIALENDQGTLTIDGQTYAVEHASFRFVNAYEMVYDLNGDGRVLGSQGETPAAKEQSSHNFARPAGFNPTASPAVVGGLGPVTVTDTLSAREFSGNDVAMKVTIGTDIYYGWISRPIKSNGIVRGFYFWRDLQFSSIGDATTDGNNDSDGEADNEGLLLVVDQSWFNGEILRTTDLNSGPPDTVATIGSSSDRVDSALNGLLGPSVAPTPTNDAVSTLEDTSVSGNVLANDTDPNPGDTLRVISFAVGGTSYSIPEPTTPSSSVMVNVTEGSLTLRADGGYTFVPTANYSGPVPVVTYTVRDDWALSATATLSITVTPVNDTPVATGESQSVPEDSPATGNVLANDTDPDGDPLTITGFTIFGQAEPFAVGTAYAITGVGSFTLNADGSYVFIPVANYNGPVPAVTYTVSDGTATATATLNLTITPVNDAPVAAPDNADGSSFATAPNCVAGDDSPADPQTGNVMSNDTDPDITVNPGVTHQVTAARSELGATLSDNTVTGRYGTLTINPDGSYSYAVDPNNAAVQALASGQSLSETFSYTITEIGTSPTLLSASSTLRIVINGGNDEPVARDDADTVNELAESQTTNGIVNFGTASGTTTVGGVLLNDFDAEGTSLSVTQITTSGSATADFLSGTAGGTSLSLTFSGVPASLSSAYFVYLQDTGIGDLTPQQLYTAPSLSSPLRPSTVTGTGNNKVVTISTASLYYEVGAGNGDSGASNEFQSITLVQTNVLGFDSASGLTAATPQYEATISSAPTPSGSATFNSVTVNTGVIAVGMTVTASGTGGSFTGTVSELTFNAAGNVITSFKIDTGSTVTAGSYSLSFSQTAAAGSVINGQYGTLVLQGNGSYTYYLTSNALGSGVPFTERFTYTATDGSCTDTAVLSINITGTQISLADTSSTANEDAVNSGTVPVGGGNLTSFSWGGSSAAAGGTISLPGVGALTMDNLGNFTFTPEPNYAGAVPSAVYTANGASATLALSITPLNDAPAGTDKTIAINDTQTYTITAADFGFSDPNDTPANAFASVKITSVSSTGGELRLSRVVGGVTTSILVAANEEILVSELPNLVFTPAANGLSDPQVVIGFQVRDNGLDGSGNVNLDQSANTLTITASRVNDAPVNTLPTTLSTNSYTPITFNTLGTVISAADPDAGDGDRDINTIVLDVSNGTLTVTAGPGVIVSGNGSGSLTLTSSGTQAELQAVLASLVYQPSPTFSGTDQLVMTTTDKLGLFDVDSRDISVAPDNRAVTVSGTIVNEASPWVLFQVDAVAIGQRVSLELGVTGVGAAHATSGLDFLPNLEYFNGTAWVAYPGGLIEIPATVEGGDPNTNALLLVRTAVVQDTAFESTSATFESLQLTARNVADTLSSGPGAVGISQIRDDGQGSIYLGNNNTFNPNAPDNTDPNGPDYPHFLDDDRALTVNDITVNEGSPFAIFRVGGVSGQRVFLELSEGSAEATDSTLELDGSDDYGPDLEYWDGSTWSDVTASGVLIPSGGILSIRTPIVNDTPYEGQETFFLTATNTGGRSATGTATINDFLGGVIYPATGAPTFGTNTGLNDDRTISVAAFGPVNEASTYAMFTVTAVEGFALDLNLQGTSATDNEATFGAFTFEYSTDGLTWTTYTWDGLSGNQPTVPPSGKVYVRVAIGSEQDSPANYEGPETFELKASYTSNPALSNAAPTSIVDDGSGTKYPGSIAGSGDPTSNTAGLDDDRPSFSINDRTVNEAAGTMTFTVTKTGSTALNSTVQYSVAPETATTGGTGAANDYTATTPGTLTFLPGETTKTIVITINNDTVFEGAETLSVNLASATGATISDATGSGTIKDDGSGGDDDASNADDANDTAKDDDRTLSVSSPTVNEASPYAVFTVDGELGQLVTLSLTSGTAESGAGEDYTSSMEVSSNGGLTWSTYTSGTVPLNGTGGTLLVRVPLLNDATNEPDETFTLRATTTGGNFADGTATIFDDGNGTIYASNGSEDTAATKDDDRALTIADIAVNEGSTYAIFTVSGGANQQARLALAAGSNNPATPDGVDYGATAAGSDLEVWTGTTWQTYTDNALVSLNASGKLLVRTAIVNDTVVDNNETFKLTATNTGGQANDTSTPENGGVATIKDDGTGTLFTNGNPTGDTPPTNPAGPFDDDRPLTVADISVNEGSPYAVFTVSGGANQRATLALAAGTTKPATPDGGDYGLAATGSDLEVWNGSAWTAYTAGATVSLNANGKLLVRVAIVNDTVADNDETFKLTATNANNVAASGTATIKDDGTGTRFTDGNPTGDTPPSNPNGPFDDDRPLKVTSPTVNEASPFAVFTVDGEPGQLVTLTPSDGTATSPDYGPALETSADGGQTWTPYVAGTQLPLDGPDGTLLVRTPVKQDTVFEGPETFKLTAAPVGGTPSEGTATITDDGTGTIFKPDGTPDDTAPKDDDRPLTVTSPSVNEASPFAIFTVDGEPNQPVTLSVADGSATSPDYGPALETSADGGKTWTPYTPGSNVTLAGTGGTLLVRTPIKQDTVSEGPETFTLTASYPTGKPTVGTATIRDDGTGDIFKPDGSTDPNAPKDDDRALTVTSPTVSEASPFAVFTVDGGPGQLVTLTPADGTATSPDYGPALETSIDGGKTWTPYTPGTTVPLNGPDGTLLVRTPIKQDSVFEGPETFTLTASPTGGNPTVGTATIRDDGAGDIFKPDGSKDPSAPKDDDRATSVLGGLYNENSPRAVFTVKATAGQPLTFDVRDVAEPGKAPTGDNEGDDPVDGDTLDNAPIYVSVDGGQNWVRYDPAVPVVAGSVPVLVAVDITNERDDVFEGEEQLQLVVNAGQPTESSGFITISDAGRGAITDPIDDKSKNKSGAPRDTAAADYDGPPLDDDRPKPPPPPPPLPPAPPAPEPAPAPAPEPPAPQVQPFNSAVVVTERSSLPLPERPAIGEVLTSASGFRATVIEAPQPALQLFRGITDQFVEGNRTSTFNLPNDAFAHTQADAVLTVEARQTNGDPLPGWMQFDAQAGTFTVTPPADFNGRELEIRVTARDNEGREATAVFKFNVGEGAPAQPQAPATGAPAGPVGPQGRSSFSEQIRLAAAQRNGFSSLLLRAQADAIDLGRAGMAPADRAPAADGLLQRLMASRAVQDRLAERAAELRGGAALSPLDLPQGLAPDRSPAGAPSVSAAGSAAEARQAVQAAQVIQAGSSDLGAGADGVAPATAALRVAAVSAPAGASAVR